MEWPPRPRSTRPTAFIRRERAIGSSWKRFSRRLNRCSREIDENGLRSMYEGGRVSCPLTLRLQQIQRALCYSGMPWSSSRSGNNDGFALDPPVSERSEEHTSELQSLAYLVCRLL